MSIATEIDIDALFRRLGEVEGKAEIIDGEVVPMGGTGPWPGYAGDEIYSSLRVYARLMKRGVAVSDNKTFRVHLPRRYSFSPDAAYHIGESQPMKYYEGAPIFAVEVRSENDYGPKPERELAAKRADYFAAGTLVVWDIDLMSNDVVRVYRADAPTSPTIYHPGEIANAEPAVPGWTMPVDDLLP